MKLASNLQEPPLKQLDLLFKTWIKNILKKKIQIYTNKRTKNVRSSLPSTFLYFVPIRMFVERNSAIRLLISRSDLLQSVFLLQVWIWACNCCVVWCVCTGNLSCLSVEESTLLFVYGCEPKKWCLCRSSLFLCKSNLDDVHLSVYGFWWLLFIVFLRDSWKKWCLIHKCKREKWILGFVN